MKQYDVIVIGGGAAGMLAAITAARRGLKTAVLEKNAAIGKKLLITGKGRCNLTNNCTAEEFLRNIPTNPRFLYSALAGFTPQDTMSFFEVLGAELKTERGRRVFPVSDRAADIVAALSRGAARESVRIIHVPAERLLISDGECLGVVCGGEELRGSVIVATGGKSYPVTGSTGDGYVLAESAGHTIIPLRPSLVPIVTAEKCSDMMGLTLKNVTLTVTDDKGKTVYSELGEMLFTHFGVSGPLVLSASAHMPKLGKCAYKLHIDLKPGLSPEQLDKRLLRDLTSQQNKDFANTLHALVPHRLIEPISRESGIELRTKANSVTREQRRGLVQTLKAFPLTPTGFRPLEEAIITSGGVSVKEINPKTMESRLVKNLFFAGEVIDVDGYTGGYNLQIAFSTGFAAGSSVLK